MAHANSFKKELVWSPTLVKMLRGKRTQAELGALIGAPKNTVWRWEPGYATPNAEHARRLSKLAERERFLADWKLAGSLPKELGDLDLEKMSKQIAREFERALARTARQIAVDR